MSDIIFIVFIAAGIIGLKKKIYGTIAGCILTIILYFYLNTFELISFLVTLIVGFAASFLGAYLISWFFSAFKGGRQSKGPSYIGGGSGKGWGQHTGGIIYSDEEREGMKPKHIKK